VQNITIDKDGWPASGKMGKMRVLITGDQSRVVTWVAGSGGSIRTDDGGEWTGDSITVGTDPKVIDFWSDSAGTIVYAHYVGTFS